MTVSQMKMQLPLIEENLIRMKYKKAQRENQQNVTKLQKYMNIMKLNVKGAQK